MMLWCIHPRDREWAFVHGDDCTTVVEAASKEEAERNGGWAVQVGSRHVPPPQVLLGHDWKAQLAQEPSMSAAAAYTACTGQDPPCKQVKP